MYKKIFERFQSPVTTFAKCYTFNWKAAECFLAETQFVILYQSRQTVGQQNKQNKFTFLSSSHKPKTTINKHNKLNFLHQAHSYDPNKTIVSPLIMSRWVLVVQCIPFVFDLKQTEWHAAHGPHLHDVIKRRRENTYLIMHRTGAAVLAIRSWTVRLPFTKTILWVIAVAVVCCLLNVPATC